MTKTIYRLTILFLLINFLCPNSFCQTITINAIANARATAGNGGYTPNGIYMNNALAKLLYAPSFGPTDIYPKAINLVSGFATTGSLTQVTHLPENQIFFLELLIKTI